MTDLVLEFIPELAQHEYLLIFVSVMFFIFFGRIFFDLFSGLFFHGNRRY